MDKFTFYSFWNDQCELMNDKDRLVFFDSLREYAFKEKKPESGPPTIMALLKEAFFLIDLERTDWGNE